MATVTTRLGPMDENLQKRNPVYETEEHRMEIVEYCLKDCPGQAHKTGVADGDGSFCGLHVHRSVHATMKKVAMEVGAVLAALQ